MTTATRAGDALRGWWGESSTADLVLVGWVALMSLSHLPFLTYDAWTPRAVLLFTVCPLGLVLLIRLVSDGDRAAQCAVGLLLWAVFASLLAPHSVNALLGFPERNLSALMLTACVAAWAVGRATSSNARRLAGDVFVAALVPHLVVGVVQIAADVNTGPFATFPGRASGLAANPVYFGALLAAGLAIVGHWVNDRSPRLWVVSTVALVFGLSLSGSRVAFVVACVALGASLRATPLRRIGLVVASAAAGMLAAGAFSAVFSGRTAIGRVSRGGAGGRTDMWFSGWHAWKDRPITGWGIGQYRTAVQGRLPDEYVRQYESTGQILDDPHNLIVNLTVSIGIVGVALFVLFVIVAAARARGSLAVASAAIAATWLLQPVVIVTAPMAALLFGMGGPRQPQVSKVGSRPVVALLVVGSLLGAGLFALDVNARYAWRNGEPAELSRAASWFGRDPRIADEAARRMSLQAVIDPTLVDEALELSRKATDYEPERVEWWTALGARQLLFGRPDDATLSVGQAFELQPNSVPAWRLELEIAEFLSEEERAAAARQRLCVLDDVVECPSPPSASVAED